VISWFRVVGIVAVFILASVGWLRLGSVMEKRTSTLSYDLKGSVEMLWGRAQVQRAPQLLLLWEEPEEVPPSPTTQKSAEQEAQQSDEPEMRMAPQQRRLVPDSTDIDVELALDHRLKGLIWYPLYDVGLDGTWRYTHTEAFPATVCAALRFPDADGLYDDFRFTVNGVDGSRALRHGEGVVEGCADLVEGQSVELKAGYTSRGMASWDYKPADEVTTLEDFSLQVRTDFDEIDFTSASMSPSSKQRGGDGWTLRWDFDRVVTGRGVGVLMPERLQPGALATRLAYAAPISLGFFFLVLFVLATLRGIDLHPVNYLFVAGGFFAFNLLFAYTVDVLPLVPAFVLTSVVSVFLVVSYLRLVVSPRFAFVEAAAAQFIYLIGFSLAYFQEGLTGLTLTVVSIVTLYLLMRTTADLNWTVVLGRKRAEDAIAPEGALSRVKGLSRTLILGEEAGPAALAESVAVEAAPAPTAGSPSPR
jgi:hypothetical protein